MKFKTKYLIAACIDGLIVTFANFFAAFTSSVLPSPKRFAFVTADILYLQQQHKDLIGLFSLLEYIVPVFLCLFYSFVWKNKRLQSKLINIPIIFSFFGTIGWFLGFLSDVIVYCVIANNLTIKPGMLLIPSFIFMLCSSLMSFTICFFTIETVHRKFILPKIFPDGHLRNYKKTIKPSVKMVNTIYYFSTTVFQALYMIGALFAVCRYCNNYKPLTVLILFGVIFFVGNLIHVIFTRYFSIPLKRLTAGAEKIKNGDLTAHVDFVSNDDFGVLTDSFNDMVMSLKSKTERVSAIQDSIIKGMAAMVESRDNSTGGHINRTSACVRIFVEHLKKEKVYPVISNSYFNNLIKAAPMHDLGKIAVDDAVLRKPGKFTDEEYEKMKTHSAEGARIVQFVLKESDDEEFKIIAENVAHYHHEKWNGTGYPEQLSGEKIPFEARVMALADVFDALVSKRCYKDKFTYDKAFQIIEESLGTHFDPNLGLEFLKCRTMLEELYESLDV